MEHIQTKVLGTLITFRVLPRDTQLRPTHYVSGGDIVNSYVSNHLAIKTYYVEDAGMDDTSVYFLQLVSVAEMLNIGRYKTCDICGKNDISVRTIPSAPGATSFGYCKICEAVGAENCEVVETTNVSDFVYYDEAYDVYRTWPEGRAIAFSRKRDTSIAVTREDLKGFVLSGSTIVKDNEKGEENGND